MHSDRCQVKGVSAGFSRPRIGIVCFVHVPGVMCLEMDLGLAFSAMAQFKL